MRKKIVVGNWKMNLLKTQAESLANEVVNLLRHVDLSETKKVILSTPSLYLNKISELTGKEKFMFSCSQNIHHENSGAYTGEISAERIKSVGVSYTLVGHSERRAYFDETNELLAKKITTALSQNIVPIYCCGEQLEDRRLENHFSVILTQIEEGLFHLSSDEFKNIIIAYEPVWAIGTGETATSDQAQEMHAFIRSLIIEKYGNDIADDLTILYGGSCKPSNAEELFTCPDVDGGLIGGASLIAEDFVNIVKAL
ncbi:MAG: triose-phosphate isomerase [Flavobacteriales bacterium]|nr:triose-phosphate isomerase [Flavobacteriales bacterium]